MKKIMLIGLLSLLTSNVYAATFPMFNEQALAGVKTFDAKFRIIIWLPEDDFSEDALPNEERFQTTANDAFILGLRRDGVTVNEMSLDTLYCDINASMNFNVVTWSVNLDYYKWSLEEEGVHTLLWEARYHSSAGISEFTPEAIAKQCQDLFAKSWLKWNPK